MGSLYHKHEVLSCQSRICVVMCLHRLEQWILATIISNIKKNSDGRHKREEEKRGLPGYGEGLGLSDGPVFNRRLFKKENTANYAGKLYKKNLLNTADSFLPDHLKYSG